MYKSGHTKSKSDTDFYSNKEIVDEISGIINRYKNPPLNIISKKQFKKQKSLKRKITNSWQRKKTSFMAILLKILLFKKYLDYYFGKYHLNLQVIQIFLNEFAQNGIKLQVLLVYKILEVLFLLRII